MRLERNTTNLQSRIQHQKRITKFIAQTRGENQLSLCQAYQRGNVALLPIHKFPL
jgi:hypothetical protein